MNPLIWRDLLFFINFPFLTLDPGKSSLLPSLPLPSLPFPSFPFLLSLLFDMSDEDGGGGGYEETGDYMEEEEYMMV
jgi:hypothetical protein